MGKNIAFKKGFTLAEVLITLGIIGIVSAITIPSLVQNYQNKVTAIKLKQTYSIMSQVFTMAIAEYGDPITWETSNLGDKTYTREESLQIAAEKYILPYIRKVKNHGLSTLSQAGYPIYRTINGKTNTNLSKSGLKYYIIELNNGTTIFLNLNSDSTLLVYIDVNGKENPNIWGKDAFISNLDVKSKYQMYSRNLNRPVLFAGCTNPSSGTVCGALILQDEWEIKYQLTK